MVSSKVGFDLSLCFQPTRVTGASRSRSPELTWLVLEVRGRRDLYLFLGHSLVTFVLQVPLLCSYVWFPGRRPVPGSVRGKGRRRGVGSSSQISDSGNGERGDSFPGDGASWGRGCTYSRSSGSAGHTRGRRSSESFGWERTPFRVQAFQSALVPMSWFQLLFRLGGTWLASWTPSAPSWRGRCALSD